MKSIERSGGDHAADPESRDALHDLRFESADKRMASLEIMDQSETQQ